MSHYIDGFVHSIPRERLDEYKTLVAEVAENFKKTWRAGIMAIHWR